MNFATLLAEKDALIAIQAGQIATLVSQLKTQALLIGKLTHELAQIKRVMFGRSSEAAALLAVQGDLFGVETPEINPIQDLHPI